jgi:hypothetical protein
MDWLRLLPRFWIQNERTCYKWDKVLNDMLDSHGVTPRDKCTCMVGNTEIWVSNWPYAYGSIYGSSFQKLPKVGTRIRLREMLEEAEFQRAMRLREF